MLYERHFESLEDAENTAQHITYLGGVVLLVMQEEDGYSLTYKLEDFDAQEA